MTFKFLGLDSKMASMWKLLWILALFVPYLVEGRRPFHIPKTLFTPALRDAHLPEGAHVIFRRAEGKEPFEQDKDSGTDFVEDSFPHGERKRRDVPTVPTTAYTNLNDSHDTMHMYWTPSSQLPNNILLLAKNTKSKTGQPSSNVYKSTDYGRTWKKINDQLKVNATTFALIDQIYISRVDPHLCILTDVTNKAIFITRDMRSFTYQNVSWLPSHILPHPRNASYVLGHDKVAAELYFSNDKGRKGTWVKVDKENVRSFQWGIEGIDTDPRTFYVESETGTGRGVSTAEVSKFASSPLSSTQLLTGVQEFESMKNYMFATVKVGTTNNVKLVVSHNGKAFVDAKFPNTEKFNRDYFVFDVEEDQVFVVINHMKNASHMYISDFGGVKYYLSIERVLYHNPYTDVSSPWLRATVPYAFVDVHKVHSMRGTYVATQLTPGRVGRRHLLNLITYNKGGKWQRIRSPTRDIKRNRIYCYLPSCSLHFNLKYGSVYHVSPSEAMVSKKSTPGLVMALGVASTNLKIFPDFFLSTDGGFNWKRVQRGKYQFSIGNYGSVIIAVPYRRSTHTVFYSTDGGDSWKSIRFHNRAIYAMDVVTQPGEKLLKFLIYGQVPHVSEWTIFFVDMTPVITRTCDPDVDYHDWSPNDGRIGDNSCVLGRQITYNMRNWTIPCKVPRNFTVRTTIASCPCTRTDFMCDFGFARKSLDQDCSLIPGEDLNKDGIIPTNCPEGSFYNRTRGYRKIPGDSCKGGYEADFGPVLTPCPVQNLKGLAVKNNKSPSKTVYIAVGGTVTFTATLVKGYLANVMFRWDFGDGHVINGTGNSFATTTHTYPRAGHFVLMVTAHNTRSTLITRLDVYVQVQLDSSKIRIFYNPPDPSINQPVLFTATVTGIVSNAIGSLSYKWDFGNGFSANIQLPSHSFPHALDYTVKVEISNQISKVTKSINVTVTQDLTPKNVDVSTITARTVTVSWTHPVANDQYVDGYKIYRSKLKDSGYTLAAAISDSKIVSRTLTGLAPYTTYYFKVASYSMGHLSTFSNIASALTLEDIPSEPQNFRAFPKTSTSIKLQWDSPQTPNGKLTKYEVQWWTSSKDIKIKTYSPTKTDATFDALKENTNYNFEVYAYTKIGKGLKAGPLSVKTNVSAPTMPPRNVAKTGSNGTCINTRWEAPYMSNNDQRLFPVEKYIVYVDGKEKLITSLLYTIVCSLKPDTDYVFEVKAKSVLGTGPSSDKKTFRTDKMNPTAPLEFTAVAKTSRSVEFTWRKPEVVDGNIKQYVIKQVEPSPNKGPFKVSGNLFKYVLTGLTPYTIYKFTIAVDSPAGRKAWSEVKEVRTPEDIPDMLTKDNVETRPEEPTSTTIRLTWTIPKPNGVITGCKIRWGHVLGHHHGNQEIDVTDPGVREYVFKHLHSNTEYSFAVQPRTKIGGSQSFSDPTAQFTGPAKNLTERLSVRIEGIKLKSRVRRAEDENPTLDKFIDQFIKAAAKAAKLVTDERIAGVDVNVKESKVEFDLLPPLKDEGVSTKAAKGSLSRGFQVGKGKTVKGSLVVMHVYIVNDGIEGTSRPVQGPGKVGAQTGAASISKNTLALAIVIPIIIIGIILLAGLVFYYRKYKNLESRYGRVTGDSFSGTQQQMNIYNGGMSNETNDEVYIDDSTNKKGRRYKDDEKMPLGEHDELAMI